MSNTRLAAPLWLACAVVLGLRCAAAEAAVDPALDLYAMPQQPVRLADGRQLNLLCMGSGRPLVLLEAGAGGSTIDWRRVQRDIAAVTRVCAYDRAGMGFSDPGPMPRGAEAVVADLSELMQAADLQPPYVLVAHSLGSYFVRLYADRHLPQIAGMVLVDPSVEYQDRRFGRVSPAYLALLRKDDQMARECLRMAQQGTLTRELPIFKECTYGYARDPSFSDALFEVQIRRRLSPTFRATLLSETGAMGADSAELAAARRSYGTMPLVVLTASAEGSDAYPGLTPGQVRAMNQLWMRMHDELAALSSRGSNRRIAHAGHYIQKDQPQAVIDAVTGVVRAVRGEH